MEKTELKVITIKFTKILLDDKNHEANMENTNIYRT